MYSSTCCYELDGVMYQKFPSQKPLATLSIDAQSNTSTHDFRSIFPRITFITDIKFYPTRSWSNINWIHMIKPNSSITTSNMSTTLGYIGTTSSALIQYSSKVMLHSRYTRYSSLDNSTLYTRVLCSKRECESSQNHSRITIYSCELVTVSLSRELSSQELIPSRVEY